MTLQPDVRECTICGEKVPSEMVTYGWEKRHAHTAVKVAMGASAVDLLVTRVQGWADDTERDDYLDEDVRELLVALANERTRAKKAEAALETIRAARSEQVLYMPGGMSNALVANYDLLAVDRALGIETRLFAE